MVDLEKKYDVVSTIGAGTFGLILEGFDTKTKEKVAIKRVLLIFKESLFSRALEKVHKSKSQILHEANMYKILRGGTGIPNIREIGFMGDHCAIVMDLLGENLEDLFKFCSSEFSLKTVLMLADQMIDRVEFVHSKSLLHRDIKPDNFTMGRSGKQANQVYIVDFGLAKQYRNPSTHEHLPYRENTTLIGTPRYASLNAHRGISQSRRDDLESLGFVLMYFLRGSLPWQGLILKENEVGAEEVAKIISETSIEVLCCGHPSEFASYLLYCRRLKFEDEPDYAYLKRLFRDLFDRKGYEFDYEYDWTVLRKQQQSQGRSAGPSSGMVPTDIKRKGPASSDISPVRRARESSTSST